MVAILLESHRNKGKEGCLQQGPDGVRINGTAEAGQGNVGGGDRLAKLQCENVAGFRPKKFAAGLPTQNTQTANPTQLLPFAVNAAHRLFEFPFAVAKSPFAPVDRPDTRA